MKIAEILKRILKKKNNEEQDISCRTCRFNAEWYCSHPAGNCYSFGDAAMRWRPKTEEGDEE